MSNELNDRIIKALESHIENANELFFSHTERLGVSTEKNRRIAQGYHDDINEANCLIDAINNPVAIDSEQEQRDNLERHNEKVREKTK